jgi:hypothetical protein
VSRRQRRPRSVHSCCAGCVIEPRNTLIAGGGGCPIEPVVAPEQFATDGECRRSEDAEFSCGIRFGAQRGFSLLGIRPARARHMYADLAGLSPNGMCFISCGMMSRWNGRQRNVIPVDRSTSASRDTLRKEYVLPNDEPEINLRRCHRFFQQGQPQYFNCRRFSGLFQGQPGVPRVSP